MWNEKVLCIGSRNKRWSKNKTVKKKDMPTGELIKCLIEMAGDLIEYD